MTGFATAAGERHGVALTVTLRSVNHRYLDVTIRLPEAARRSEARIRERIAAVLDRGRIEVAVEAGSEVGGDRTPRLDAGLVEALEEIFALLEERPWLRREVTLGQLLAVPGLLRLESVPMVWEDAQEGLLLELLDRALEEMVATREREGRALEAALSAQTAALGEACERLEARRPEVAAALRDGLQLRLREWLGDQEIEPARLVQEVALAVERSDVQEEIDRLRGHLVRLAECLDADGAVGRRLDFLAQEILRELQTLGAKCRDDRMAAIVLEAKLACERLREQAQNVE